MLANTRQQNAINVRVWALPSARENEPNRIAAYRVVKRFEELHPEIKLQGTSYLQIEGAGADPAVLMQIAGGNAPDVLTVNFRQSDTYIKEGFLWPLDEYLEELSPTEMAERFPPNLRPVVWRPGPDGTEHYWAYPVETGVTVLYYRKDYFVEAGLDPSKPPSNWAELEDYAKRLTDPSIGRYGLIFGAAWSIMPYLQGAGASVVAENPDGSWRALFDSPEAVKAFSFVDTLLNTTATRGGKKGPIAYRGTDFYPAIRQGKIAMYYGYLGSTDPPLTDPDLTGFAPIPAGPDGHRGNEINARMLGIFAGVKDPRVRDAAWEYIHFMGSAEAHRVFTQAMVELGAGRNVNPEWLREFGYPDLAGTVQGNYSAILEEGLQRGTPEPYGKNCQLVYFHLGRPLDKMQQLDFAGMSPAARDAAIQDILRRAVADTNESMLGIVPEPERRWRALVAWTILSLIAVGLFLWGIYLARARRVIRLGSPANSAPARKNWMPLLLLVPAAVLVAVWHYYPLARGSAMAFQDYKIMLGSQWVGIENFANILFDKQFWLSMKNALYFCALWMVLGFFPPVLLAILLQEIPRGKVLFRVLFYLPAVVSGVVILFMWREIFDPSPGGALNHLLGLMGIGAQRWLQDPHLAMLCVVFPLAWAHLGPGCIIYLAALKGIPNELYEASDIDGANFFAKLRWIVLPYLKPLLVINAVGATIFGFKSSDAVLAMTGGGPDLATQVVGYEIWQRTFLYLKFGQGTAMAWVLGFVLMAFTVYQMRVLTKVEFRTAGGR